MENKLEKPVTRRRWFIPALVIVLIAALCTSGAMLDRYVFDQLHQESVSQLEELSQQLFEKLEVQIDNQWDYLENMRASLAEKDDMTRTELAETIAHCEKDLGPNGKQLYFRVIDEDGYYYTNAGRQGLWSGIDRLSGAERQCFTLADWLDNESYMVFALKVTETMEVDGHRITYLVLLRSMTDMQPYFRSSAFGNQNMTYIISYDGFVLASDGDLPGIDFKGNNVFYRMEEQTYPHMGSFDAVLEKGNPSGTVCTDVIIGGEKYYLVYDRLPDYDWAMLLLMSADDVAVSATEMVHSMLRVFLLLACVLGASALLIFGFIMRIQRDKRLMEVKVQSEKVLQEANRELQNLQDETDKARLVAEKATLAKSQFLANMSHDIRTPMNAIMGVTHLMEHETENPERLRYHIRKLQTSGRHMLSLINDILDMSKIETGEVQLIREPIKMAEQVGQIESIIRPQSNEKGQVFTIRIHEVTHEYLFGDSIRIRQIFLNLLTNAVKYTPSGGSILFEIRELPCEKPNHATLLTSVIDNGHGMSAEFLTRIFEPFTRETSTLTNKIQGTGLGMSITKSLVDLMDGTITVESEVEKGSRFDVTLTLPIDVEAMSVSSIRSVLLVSDDEMLVTNVKASLREISVALRVVATSEEAAALLREEPIDAILLSGYLVKGELTDTVRNLRSAARGAVLVFCCDYAHRASVRDMLIDSGVNGLIARPFFFENLMLAVDHSREKGANGEREGHLSPLDGKRFLCAEDNALNAEILDAMLALHGASCTIYPDGAELVKAFASVRPGDYDAILMDMQMPNMNGVEATRVLRSGGNPLGKTIPIIAMTANAFTSDVEECLDAGMDAHLAKPLDLSALERTLQELLNENDAR